VVSGIRASAAHKPAEDRKKRPAKFLVDSSFCSNMFKGTWAIALLDFSEGEFNTAARANWN
jgi:hypothetical protein